MITFHLPPSQYNTLQQEDKNIVTMDALSSEKEEKKETAVHFADNQGVLLNTNDIQLQQEGDASSALLNFQGTTVPVNLIKIAANEAEVTQSATIQDLAQITVDHLFFASILFRVCRVQCLFANTKIREMPFKKLLYLLYLSSVEINARYLNSRARRLAN
jgi:hypothetical protein